DVAQGFPGIADCLVQVGNRFLERSQRDFQVGIAREVGKVVRGIGRRCNQALEVDVVQLGDRLGRLLLDRFELGRDRRYFAQVAAAGDQGEVGGLIRMQIDVDVEQSGKEALRV